jgi:ABC-2 type transport system permease protein
MISVLLRPKLLSIRNRWRQKNFTRRHGRDVGILIFAALIMSAMYRGTLWSMEKISDLPFLVYIPPYMPLSLILMVLMVMITISALATALGSFFFADDIELLLATPTSPFGFFAARFIYVLLTASWMPFVFIFPVLLAMGNESHLGSLFLLVAVTAMIPYFVIPVAVSTIAATLIMAVLDARWTRIIVLFGIAAVLSGILYAADMFATLVADRNDPGQILRMVNTLSAANVQWSPYSWTASILSEFIVPTGKSIPLRGVLLYATAGLFISISYLCFELLHSRGYTRAHASIKVRSWLGSAPSRVRARALSPQRAIIGKEFRSIFRDLAQSTQVIFVGGICILYVMNIRLFVSIDAFPAESRFYWKNVFFVMHCCITAFFTSSICTRIVFSSVSLEGKQFWLLRIAPLEVREILRAKLIAWYRPIALVSALLLGMGIYVIEPRWEMVILFVSMSFFVSYGIVGVGIGLGAHFADFSWEHPSQLILSLGSLLYMLTSTALVLINIIPLVILLRFSLARLNNSPEDYLAVGILAAAAVIVLNLTIGYCAMRLGERSLRAGEST